MAKWFVVWDDEEKKFGAASNFTRQWIRDLFSSPFWDNIPDKPSEFPPEAHASTHAAGGDDELSGLTYEQLASNTIVFTTYFPVPDSHQTGLDASTTGIKWTSLFRGEWDKRHLKKVRIRGEWEPTEGKMDVKIAVRDIDNNADVVSIEKGGMVGDGVIVSQEQTTDLSNVTDGGLFEVYVAVTNTIGPEVSCSFNLRYIVVELIYGIS